MTDKLRSRRRDLRAMHGDGLAFSLMVGVGEAYVPAFALAVGLGELRAGLLATIPMLAGAVVQLASPLGVQLLRSHRRWVVTCALVQAASFVPLLAGALAGRISTLWVFAAASAYWGFGMATGPAWNTWAETLVPARIRASFFASRTRWMQAMVLAGVLAGGSLLQAAGRSTLAVFALLFAVAAAARLASATFLAVQSEPDPLPAGIRTLHPAEFLSRLRREEGGGGALLAHVIALQLATHVAAPFFTPYMLSALALSYLEFTSLTAAAFLARVAVMPSLGRYARRHGPRPLIVISSVVITVLPSLWLVSSELPYLIAVQLLSGAAWGALELAILLSFFDHIDARERTSVLTYYNLCYAVAIVAGTLVGAAVFREVAEPGVEPVGVRAYWTLFLLSSALRLPTLLLVRRIPKLARVHSALPLRTLGVRPGLGAVARPVLAAEEPAEPEPPDAQSLHPR